MAIKLKLNSYSIYLTKVLACLGLLSRSNCQSQAQYY